MSDIPNERIAAVADAEHITVTLSLGQVQVSVRAPGAPGSAQMRPDALRATAMKSARRALEVALEEIITEGG